MIAKEGRRQFVYGNNILIASSVSGREALKKFGNICSARVKKPKGTISTAYPFLSHSTITFDRLDHHVRH